MTNMLLLGIPAAVVPSSICAIFHKVAPGLKNDIGPNLFGAAKSAAASALNYIYSSKLKGLRIRWLGSKLMGLIKSQQQECQVQVRDILDRINMQRSRQY